MKSIVLLLLIVFPIDLQAQYVKKRNVIYEGSVELKNGVSLNGLSMSTFGVETVHGVLLVEKTLFLNMGAGINIIHYTPYFHNLTGNLTLDMFAHEHLRMYCPMVTIGLEIRMANIRKLRNKMIPFGQVKFMHLWNIDKKGVYFRGHEMLEGVYFPVNTLNSTWVEFCVGTEFILKDLPNVYIGLGLLTISGAESGGKILAGRDESTEFEGTYDMNNDSVQDIPAQIYGFLGSGGKVGGDSIAKCIYCNLNLGEKICTVLNESDSELYIDILHVGDERLMSIFSSMLDWVSWMSVPSHSERSFWFTGDYKLSDKFLLVGSRKGLPLNGIFKFYRPGVKYKEHFLGIKLILVQVR